MVADAFRQLNGFRSGVDMRVDFVEVDILVPQDVAPEAKREFRLPNAKQKSGAGGFDAAAIVLGFDKSACGIGVHVRRGVQAVRTRSKVKLGLVDARIAAVVSKGVDECSDGVLAGPFDLQMLGKGECVPSLFPQLCLGIRLGIRLGTRLVGAVAVASLIGVV